LERGGGEKLGPHLKKKTERKEALREMPKFGTLLGSPKSQGAKKGMVNSWGDGAWVNLGKRVENHLECGEKGGKDG